MDIEAIFPATLAAAGNGDFRPRVRRLLASFPQSLPALLEATGNCADIPPFLADLARLEHAVDQAKQSAARTGEVRVEQLCVAPSLRLLRLDWRNLAQRLDAQSGKKIEKPSKGEEFILIYHGPESGKLLVRPAGKDDLLALKIVAESLDSDEVAQANGVAVGTIDSCLDKAARRGILLAPPSRIRRESQFFPRTLGLDERFYSSPVFTLQWHITQECDLHCRHCYDRSERRSFTLEQGVEMLDDFRRFCRAHHVTGQISFTGGNPLLHPNFFDFYEAARQRNMMTAILGNPASRATMEKIIAIGSPVFYQVSLEGLREHNDYIRGHGHFNRVLEFLALLRELKVYSMVMLTLTRDNMEQVLPLAELLRERTDLFTFNRLAMVGEGARLASADKNAFQNFLRDYLRAAGKNQTMSLKDNLFNILFHDNKEPLFGGCTGHGCGAAFHFMAVLADGEVHACRKFPSPIGTLREQEINDIYHGERAAGYRRGAAACAMCPIRPVCGGCLAVTHGMGGDPLRDKDPYCFLTQQEDGPAQRGQ